MRRYLNSTSDEMKKGRILVFFLVPAALLAAFAFHLTFNSKLFGTEALKTEAAETAPNGQPRPEVVAKAKSEAQVCLAELEALLKAGNYAAMATALEKMRPLAQGAEARGLFLYYQSELRWGRGEPEEAYYGFRQASLLVTDRYRLSASLMRMAEFQARGGKREAAAAYAAKAADLMSDTPWRLQQAGDLFARLDLFDKANAYYYKALQLQAASPRDRARAHLALGRLHGRRGNRDRFLSHIRQYVEAIDIYQGPLTADEQGAAAYYKAILLESDGQPEKAYFYYERAAGLLEEKEARSRSYLKMAGYQAVRGNPALAAKYMAAAGRKPEGRAVVGPSAMIALDGFNLNKQN